MSIEINLDDIFKNIIENIDNNSMINNYVDIISNNFYNTDYIKFVKKIIELLDDTSFILIFLNKFFEKQYELYKFIIIDIIKNINNNTDNIDNNTDNIDIIKIKNLFLLDIIDYDIIYEIINIYDIDILNFMSIYDFIYEIGKINIINDLLDDIIINNKLLSYKNLFKILLSLLKFQKKILDTDFYVDITSKLSSIMYIILPIFELKEFIQKLLFNDLENTHINEHLIIIFDFFKIVINNHDKYFNICIIDNIFELLNLLIKIDFNIDSYVTILDDLCKLLLTNIINIHEKTKIFTNIAKIIIHSNYVPYNLIIYIDYYITNINFLSWSTIDEKILILEYISKLLLKIKSNDKLYYDKYDNILYNILYIETESFNILKILLSANISYTDYNLIKNTSYNIITIINILNDIQFIYFDYCKEDNIYYADLLHKNNLLLNTYILYFTENNSKDIYKFNINLIFNTLIINKMMILYKHLDYKLFPLNSIEYEILENYYNNNNINLFYNFLSKLNIVKEKSNNLTDFITKYNDTEFIDNIFSIEIVNPIMIPQSTDFFEKCTMYLLIRESQKNPYTREELTIADLIEYNMRDDIKNKINSFLVKKNNLL
jgi:hypothetical protein